MTSKEKIEYVWNKIIEAGTLSPTGMFYVDCAPLIDIETNNGIPDDAPEIISKVDQVRILQKLHTEGRLVKVDFVDNHKGAWVVLTNPEVIESTPIPEKEDSIIKIEVKNGELAVNKDTGYVKLNEIEHSFNPISSEFKFLLLLLDSKNYTARYSDILGEANSKPRRHEFTQTVKRLKTALGILPSNKPKNTDIISNIRGVGYKILLK